MTLNKTKISVCITALPSSEFLIEQLQSINSQDLLPDEVIISFDFVENNDKKGKIVNEITLKNNLSNIDDVQIFYQHRNLGPADNFKQTIIKSTGDIIFLTDHDDIWFNNKISKCVELINKNKPSILLHNARLLGSDKSFKNDFVYKRKIKLHFLKSLLKNEFVGAFMVLNGNFAREVCTKFNTLKPMHDWVFILYALKHKSRILQTLEPFQFYRRHPDSVTGKESFNLNKVIRALKYRINLIKML